MKSSKLRRHSQLRACGAFAVGIGLFAQSAQALQPMRPLPVPVKQRMASGPKLFVDAARGSDANPGSAKAPWKSLTFAVHQLKPGDTLYLRGGVYYEKFSIQRSGTEKKPITISSYPGELAIVDGGLSEFRESPSTAWQPYEGGADGEYVSTKTYTNAYDSKGQIQLGAASKEIKRPVEKMRPLALGNFADSMVPLHGYRIAADLRSKNELWLGEKTDMVDIGNYGGPGIWFNRETGRIHIRLAHTRLEGLGSYAYSGETDPRKLPLIISVGYGEDVIKVGNAGHVRLQGLVVRGASNGPTVNLENAYNITLDHMTVYGGSPALRVGESKDIRVTNSAFRGLAAPWISRAHMKYRGTASYQIVFLEARKQKVMEEEIKEDEANAGADKKVEVEEEIPQKSNENVEFAYCEFTDDHDFALFRHAKNLQFHHNLVDNFNDDGIEIGPKLPDHSFYIYQNRISRCLIPLTQHQDERGVGSAVHEPDTGAWVYRNVFDTRGGTYKFPPGKPDPTGAYLHEEGHLGGDHGSPIWPVIRFYHNVALRNSPTWRDSFLFGLGVHGLYDTERDVFNSIFVQTNGMPGASFAGMQRPENLREGGNILWGLKDGPAYSGDMFAKFRTTSLYTGSQQRYKPGWTTHDKVINPRFSNQVASNYLTLLDLRLQPDSPAVNAGQTLPSAWPDSLRDADKGAPDIGALPAGVKPWGIGVNGRLSLFGPDFIFGRDKQ